MTQLCSPGSWSALGSRHQPARGDRPQLTLYTPPGCAAATQTAHKSLAVARRGRWAQPVVQARWGWPVRHNGHVRLTVKADYAIRALAELAARSDGVPVKAEELADAQNIPRGFLLGILAEVRNAGLISSQRGHDGGFALRRSPKEISLADVIRAVNGPLAMVGDDRPGEVTYTGAATILADVWVAVRANLRAVLEHVTLADLAANRVPKVVQKLTKDPDSWEPH